MLKLVRRTKRFLFYTKNYFDRERNDLIIIFVVLRRLATIFIAFLNQNRQVFLKTLGDLLNLDTYVHANF